MGTRQIQARLAQKSRQLKARPSDLQLRAEVQGLRTEFRTQSLADHITRVVDAAPPLTPEQRDRLAVLLRSPDAAA